jgi:hypothetical protein
MNTNIYLMAHKVKVTMIVPAISKVDTIYEIYAGGNKLGTLKISKGGINYLPANYKTNSIRKNWTQLHELLIS